MGFVKLEKQGHVGIVTIDRQEALNALNSQVLSDLDAVIDQVAADESFALAVVVPESVTRFINEQHDIKTEPKQRYIVSQDTSIHDAGAEDGYGYGKGDRIAEVA